MVEKVKAASARTQGFDAERNEYVDMMRAGIIDPTKVERIALQNAASIASLLLTTEALITDIPEKGASHAGDFCPTGQSIRLLRRPPGHPASGGRLVDADRGVSIGVEGRRRPGNGHRGLQKHRSYVRVPPTS